MAPNIKFFVDNGLDENFDLDLGGSGLGFYGLGGSGSTVSVGSYQDYTYATDANGTGFLCEACNVKATDASTASGYVNHSLSLSSLQSIVNGKATFNIRFDIDNTGTPVNVQNTRLYIYDRVNIANPASGVTTKVYEVIHPGTGLGANASGWQTLTGTGNWMLLSINPGSG